PALVVKSNKENVLIITQENSEKWEVLSKIDIAFPLVHGPFGEDGSLQGFFEVLNIPYVGCDHYSSSLCMDKGWCKSVLQSFGFKTANWITFNHFEYSPQKCLNALKDKGITYPLFVKPSRLGSSVGISKVKDEKELFPSIENAFNYDSSIVLEEAVTNCREIEVSVLDDTLKGRKKTVCSLPGEVIPSSKHGFYSYEAKYLDKDGAVLNIPANLSEPLLEQVQNQALRAFKVLRCRGMARVDLFLKENAEVLINEINTIPGFTKISMYPKLWQVSGLSPEALIEKLVASALLDT
ncbi:MAG: D-alanine--D-alanine ligase, partial [Candidatus Dadabacteria bacterium]